MNKNRNVDIGLDLLRTLYSPSKSYIQPGENIDIQETKVASRQNVEAPTYGEKPITLRQSRYGKILGTNGSTDWVGNKPFNNFHEDPFGWDGAGKVAPTILNTKIRGSALFDSQGLLDVPITFMSEPTGQPYKFTLASHYEIREDLSAILHGDQSTSRMNRAAFNYEVCNIGGKNGDPYPHTGYDVFALIKNPHFWAAKNDEVTGRNVNDRFPVSYPQSESDFIVKSEKTVKESWGFPAIYPDSQRYFALAAKIISLLHNKPFDWESVLLVTNGFQETDSPYANSVKKLDFVRLLHDLRGKWLYFGTNPNLGANMSFHGINFPDREYFVRPAKYSGKKAPILLDLDKLELSDKERVVASTIEAALSHPLGRPAEGYTNLQAELAGILG